MSHEITSTDNAVFAKTAAWHGLGTVLPEHTTAQDAFKRVMDWDVESQTLLRKTAEGKIVECGHNAVIRKDNDAVLGYVSPSYKTFNNREFAGFVEQACGKTKFVESALTMRGGKLVAMLVDLGRTEIEARGTTDALHQYGMFSTSHDGSQGLRLCATNVRVVCKNTFDAANASGKQASLRHTATIDQRAAADAADFFAGTMEAHNVFAVKAEALANVELSQGDLELFLTNLYNRQIGKVIIDPKTKGEKKSASMAMDTISQWMSLAQGRTANGMERSAWAAFNAVTEWADHHRTVRGESEDSTNRTFSRLLGTGNDLKGKVWNATCSSFLPKKKEAVLVG